MYGLGQVRIYLQEPCKKVASKQTLTLPEMKNPQWDNNDENGAIILTSTKTMDFLDTQVFLCMTMENSECKY